MSIQILCLFLSRISFYFYCKGYLYILRQVPNQIHDLQILSTISGLSFHFLEEHLKILWRPIYLSFKSLNSEVVRMYLQVRHMQSILKMRKLEPKGLKWPAYIQLHSKRGFLGGSAVKKLPAVQELQEALVWSLRQEDPSREGMATHSSTLAWRIAWTEEPGGLQSLGLQSVRHDWSALACLHAQQTADGQCDPLHLALLTSICILASWTEVLTERCEFSQKARVCSSDCDGRGLFEEHIIHLYHQMLWAVYTDLVKSSESNFLWSHYLGCLRNLLLWSLATVKKLFMTTALHHGLRNTCGGVVSSSTFFCPLHTTLEEIFSRQKCQENPFLLWGHDVCPPPEQQGSRYLRCFLFHFGRQEAQSKKMVTQLVKNLPAMWNIWVQSLGWEDSLEKGTSTLSSILKNSMGLYGPWGCKESEATERLSLP